MNYDITFCSKNNCKNKECKRNQSKIEDITRTICITDFKDCEYWGTSNETI